jgi:hypothetical protein
MLGEDLVAIRPDGDLGSLGFVAVVVAMIVGCLSTAATPKSQSRQQHEGTGEGFHVR